jgi:hypothetical protein
MSADIKWVRGKEVRNQVLAQPVEMERVYRIIEKRSEKRRDIVKVVGELLAWSIPKKSFTIRVGDQEPISGHWGPNFQAPARVRRVPSRYRAVLTKETTIHYARDKDDVVWFLDRLTPVRTRKPK